MKTKLLCTFLIFVSGMVFSQQANDTCANAEPLAITTTSQQVDFDITSLVYTSQNGCDSGDVDNYTNFWYEFTMPTNSNLYINVTIHNKAQLYDACNGTPLYCFTGIKLLSDLVGGQTYKLRIFKAQTSFLIDHFFIKSYDKIANDDCANAQVLPTLTSDNTQVQFQLAGASVTQDETCSGVIENDIADAWFEFTMPITGNLFVDAPNGIAIYDACNGNELYCNASESSLEAFKLIDNLTQGNTYLLRFFSTIPYIFGFTIQNINLRVYDRAANDECVDAEVIPSITTTSQQITFDTFGSLINFENSCVGLPQEDFVDVWFEFTMPNNTYLMFESYAFNFFAIYDTCNGNEVDCFGGNEQVSGLTPNQTYILRVFQRQTEMFHPNKYFNIYGTNTLSDDNFNTQEVTMKMIDNKGLVINNLNSSATLNLYNLIGQQVIETRKLQPDTKQFIKFSNDLETGIYIARLKTSNGAKSLKLIIGKNN